MESVDAANAVDTLTGIIEALENEVEMKNDTIDDFSQRIEELENELEDIKSRFELD